MIKDKKGALELSINTIVVIVIGVTLLTLGLIFVKNIFSKVTSLSDNVFDNAQSSIKDISHTGKFNSPTSISIEQSKKKTFNMYVSHDGSGGSGQKTFKLTLIPNGNFENYVKAKIISPDSVRLDEGKEATFTIQIVATSDAPLSLDSSYQTKVMVDNQEYAVGGFAVEVIKSSGLLG